MHLGTAALSLVLAYGSAAGTAPVMAGENDKCLKGEWKRIQAKADTPDAKLPLRYETPHFAFRWSGESVSPELAKAAGVHLEYVWAYFVDALDFPAPDCASAHKRKVNIHIDPTFGLSGGADDAGNIGMWIGPGGLKDRFGLAHELTHALQAGTGSFRDTPYGGWLWESHANWMTTQLPEFRSNTHCSVLSANYPHLYYGSTRVRYCNWQFLEHIKNRFGYTAINDVWRKAPKAGTAEATQADPLEVLMRNQGWSISQLNDAFGDWALHNANWNYTNPDGSDQGAIYRRAYGGNDPHLDRPLRTTTLDALDKSKRRFAVPVEWAPQRWGYNLVRLFPDRNANRVTALFRGIVQAAPAVSKLPGLADEPATIPQPDSGWRWGLVAVASTGKSRYTALQRGADGHASISLEPGDQALYMVVVGAPSRFQHIRWEQPYYSIYRYPWMVQLAGALPEGHQQGASAPLPGGKRHPNGGGWIGPSARVEPSAYIGRHARVISGSVRGDARIEGLSVIRGNTIVQDRARVATVFSAIGELEQGIVISGTAQLIGDVEQRGASVAHGVHYGFVDPSTANDQHRGAGLTTPVAEVTKRPSYRWRP